MSPVALESDRIDPVKENTAVDSQDTFIGKLKREAEPGAVGAYVKLGADTRPAIKRALSANVLYGAAAVCEKVRGQPPQGPRATQQPDIVILTRRRLVDTDGKNRMNASAWKVRGNVYAPWRNCFRAKTGTSSNGKSSHRQRDCRETCCGGR